MENRITLFGFKSNIFFNRIVEKSSLQGIGYLEDLMFDRYIGLLKPIRLLFFIKVCRAVLLTFQLRNTNVFNFYYLNREAEILINLNRRKKIIVTLYGSEYLIYNSSIFSLRSMVDQWVVSTHSGKKTLMDVYNISADAISVISFGVDSIKGSPRSLWVDEHVICIGNNGSLRQNHVQILEWFWSFREILPKNTRIVLPMTYGFSENHFKECERILKSLKIEYTILTEYLTNDDICAIHDSVDIYINNQPTDVLSGFMLSQLNRGVVVIVNSDLHYPDLASWGVHLTYFKSRQELKDALQNFGRLRAKSSTNIDRLSDKFAWHTCSTSYCRLWDSI